MFLARWGGGGGAGGGGGEEEPAVAAKRSRGWAGVGSKEKEGMGAGEAGVGGGGGESLLFGNHSKSTDELEPGTPEFILVGFLAFHTERLVCRRAASARHGPLAPPNFLEFHSSHCV